MQKHAARRLAATFAAKGLRCRLLRHPGPGAETFWSVRGVG